MDVVICNFPPMLKNFLPAAPAVLQGACDWLGLSSKFIDFNLQTKDIDNWASQILYYKPKILALSIFSYQSRDTAIELANKIKSLDISIKIVAGGSGIKNSLNGKVLIEVDHVIEGDGEYQWPKFLADEFNLTVEYFSELNAPYLPTFIQYDIESYQQHGEIWVPVTGSRGCVRRCTFCEIPDRWEFGQRSADSIAAEIENILKICPQAKITFTDSLVNGSLPAFEKLLDRLIETKQKFPLMRWKGQFIIRNKKQCPDQYWKKIADSGAEFLEIGVETGSEELRYRMNKPFTNDDLDHSIAHMKKYNIIAIFLMFVGYPEETADDFQKTMDLLERSRNYAQDGTIQNIQLGHNFALHPGSPVYRQSQQPGSKLIASPNPSIWFNKNNPESTYKVRLDRRRLLEQRAVELGYTLSVDNHSANESLELLYEQNKQIIHYLEKQK